MKSTWIGAVLVVAAPLVAGWRWGWQGALFGSTVVVFWLLLQFSRTMRLMQRVGQAPKGRVDSVVRVQSKLQAGQRLIDVLGVTGSLGEKVAPEDGAEEAWRWTDEGGDVLTLQWRGGRLTAWQLQRADEAAAPAAPA